MSILKSLRSTVLTLAVAAAIGVMPATLPASALAALNTAPPSATTKLVFIHHSTGEAWLQDGYGNLASTLGANHYFVSDTNYGWGPSSIGDFTDIGHWWTWSRGPSASTYTAALYANTGINSGYTRSLADPGGENSAVMFKSCFPNSAVGGSAADAIPAIGSNPLKGNSGPLTVGNIKGIYLDLLPYFASRPDTLFVLIVSPPLRSADTNASQAANARYLANWLTDPGGYLSGYTAGNVFVFDYYTVLTGGHHRVVSGVVDHTPGPTNYLAFPTGDSHPSAAGDQIATSEFVPMLNAAYNAWKAGAVVPPATFTLRYAAGANGSISGDASQTVVAGASGAAVTAVADTGYHFVNWSDGATANPRTDTGVSANVDVTASFAADGGGGGIMMPVWRFRNLQNGFYLWSFDPAERANINTNLRATWKEEGVAYTINVATNASPLWRFRNIRGGYYLYTADPTEKANIQATLTSMWQFEGEAYQVSMNPSGSPVWRFRNLRDGTYLLSSDPAEKDTIVATLQGTWLLEGAAFYLAP